MIGAPGLNAQHPAQWRELARVLGRCPSQTHLRYTSNPAPTSLLTSLCHRTRRHPGPSSRPSARTVALVWLASGRRLWRETPVVPGVEADGKKQRTRGDDACDAGVVSLRKQSKSQSKVGGRFSCSCACFGSCASLLSRLRDDGDTAACFSDSEQPVRLVCRACSFCHTTTTAWSNPGENLLTTPSSPSPTPTACSLYAYMYLSLRYWEVF
mmetsp:Transcript_27260/g.56044  ORF Transcript_27260/g.56044 Transcript_27260/m.56044 type:complete len:211 (-) Transcript_27260:563-1195(-)